jgi:hypothetical protein
MAASAHSRAKARAIAQPIPVSAPVMSELRADLCLHSSTLRGQLGMMLIRKLPEMVQTPLEMPRPRRSCWQSFTPMKHRSNAAKAIAKGHGYQG